MTEYKRQCDNWLADFARWTIPRSEAPEIWIFWAGLYALSAAVRRHVKISREYLGSWECAPNIYLMFVGEPGSRKTTTGDYAYELIQSVDGITMAPDQVSMPKLLTALVESPDSSMCIHSGEFGEFMQKSGTDMYSFLTNAFDGKKKIEVGTHIRGVEFVERPCVTLFGATTPAWIAANMPEDVIGGGFASRVVFIYEDSVRQRRLFYKDKVNFEEIDDIGDRLKADLQHIANIKGDFELTQEAMDFMEPWYAEAADKISKKVYHLQGYHQRKPAHIMKVAQLIKLSRCDELLLDVDDFKEALEVVEMTERKLGKVFGAVGKNAYTVDMRRILAFINENGRTNRKLVNATFMNAATPKLLEELVVGLATCGLITITISQDGEQWLEAI